MTVTIRRSVHPPNAEQLQALNNLDSEDVRLQVEKVDKDGNVKTLEIWNAPFSAFPTDFLKLYGMEVLVLNRCENLNDLSPLSSMRDLKCVCLGQCPALHSISSFPNDYVASKRTHSAPNLLHSGPEMHSKALLLLWHETEEVPSVIGDLQSVETLCVDAGSRAPPIENFISLKRFELCSDTMTRLPEAIGQLDSIETLGFQCKQLVAIPPNIWKLPNLQSIGFMGCISLRIPSEHIFECSDTLIHFVDEDGCLNARTRLELDLVVRLNQAGRGFLGNGDASLWCHVLDRCSNDVDAIQFFLTQKPDLVSETRKRKRS